jgi:hypothetical protein
MKGFHVMIGFKHWGRRHERGQTAVIAGLSMVVLISLVGLVIDGGYAWGRQRQTQNGSDAVAKAGAVVIQHFLADIGTQTDREVACAVEEAARLNDVDLVMAEYTTEDGTVMGPVGDCASTTVAIPEGAQGVRATTEQEFDTFIAGVVGMDTWTAAADATAIVGPFQAVCPASAGCGALPVTFPQTFEVCDDTSAEYIIGDDVDGVWQPYEVLPPNAELTRDNLAIIPLCPDNPGSVGWLDFGCGNLAEHIEDPCSVAIPIPSWEQTHTGNINCCEVELEEYTGEFPGTPEADDLVVPLPIHIMTCSADRPNPSDTCEPTDADWSGEGNNNFFRVKFWIGFKFDEANVSGSDTSCQDPPGTPQIVNPGGGLGCLKGWIVARYDAPGSIGIGIIDPDFAGDIGITLIE